MLDSITSPTLLVSERRVRANLKRMSDRAKRHGLQLCPHFKTHQSLEVGAWCQDYGIEEITVTSLRMARFFAEAGWEKIAIALPLNARQLGDIEELAQSTELSVFLVSPAGATSLAEGVRTPLGYFIEIDAGYGRSGVPWRNTERIRSIIQRAGRHRFRGFYVHSGHTYDTVKVAAIGVIHQTLLERLAELKTAFADLRPVVATGDTPTCSTQEDFRGIDRIGPGNFIYYDLTQEQLGACAPEDIAACTAVPVVQHKGKEIIVHGGWVQLGKDALHLPSGATIYGRMVLLNHDGSWDANLPLGTVTKLSQEHGTIQLAEGSGSGIHEGDLVGILPVHACAAVHGLRATGRTMYIDSVK